MAAHTENSGHGYRDAKTAEELTEDNVGAIQKLGQAAHADRGGMDVLADRISGFCGSPSFFWFHIAWFAVWIGADLIGIAHFDPFPYTFLTLVVSLEAIFLSMFILMSQNHSAKVDEKLNQLDLQINLLTEQENTKILLPAALASLGQAGRACRSGAHRVLVRALPVPAQGDIGSEAVASVAPKPGAVAPLDLRAILSLQSASRINGSGQASASATTQQVYPASQARGTTHELRSSFDITTPHA